MKDITFWYANKWQIEEVIELRKNVWVYNSDEDQEYILSNVIDRDPKAILIGILDNKIIASTMLVFHPFQTFIYRFWVHSEFTSQQIGTLLAQKIDEELISRWMLHPTLFVEWNNEIGKKFWTKQWRENLYSVDCYVKNLEK